MSYALYEVSSPLSVLSEVILIHDGVLVRNDERSDETVPRRGVMVRGFRSEFSWVPRNLGSDKLNPLLV